MNPPSPAHLLNRIITVLGFVGIFISGTLSWSHIVRQIPPCGSSGGCTTVLMSQFAYFFGVPVAFLGLGAYVAVTGISIARQSMVGSNWTLQTRIGFGLTLIGTLISFTYTFISLSMMGEVCLWCVGSAATMTALFLTHAFLMAKDAPTTPSRFDLPAVAGGGLLAVLLMGISIAQFQAGNERKVVEIAAAGIGKSDLLPANAVRVKGSEAAKVVLVEFADPNCPACRSAHGNVKQMLGRLGDGVAYAFRILPLYQIPGHETSIQIGMAMMYAAENGKYNQFFDAIFDSGNTERIKQLNGVLAIASEVGLNQQELQDVIDKANEKSTQMHEKFLDEISKDMGMAKSLGVSSTPTFIVWAEGQPLRNVPGAKLEQTLSTEPYASIMGK